MFSISMLAWICNNSAVRCGVEPCPGLMTLSLLFSALAFVDELRQPRDARRRVHEDDVGRCAELGDGDEVAERVIARVAIEAGVDEEAGRGDQQGIAIGG